MRKTVTLTLDLGMEYSSDVKGRLLSINPDLNIVDISYNIPFGDLFTASFLLCQAVKNFNDAIHLCMVDPFIDDLHGVVVVESDSTFVIGADNGSIYASAMYLKKRTLYRIVPDPSSKVTSSGGETSWLQLQGGSSPWAGRHRILALK